jgi:cyclic beta-1,2-glucan synthetase
MLNPVNHAATLAAVERYRTEPYVVAADVYSGSPYAGRGGWTWYTGSAGWLYQAGMQAILGLDRNGDQLRVNPCIPEEWNGFQVNLRRGNTRYEIQILRKLTEEAKNSSDQVLKAGSIHLSDDKQTHRLAMLMDGGSE